MKFVRMIRGKEIPSLHSLGMINFLIAMDASIYRALSEVTAPLEECLSLKIVQACA